VRETLDSILAQTFTDFELIISDNASTDQTEEICREYALRDKRIRYYRNDKNLGIARNFNRAFELSQGQYFQWTSHDDLYDQTYLEKCVEVLDNCPAVVLCHAQAQIIDGTGQFLFDEGYKLRTNSTFVGHRFGDLICASHHQHRGLEQFGVIRASALKETALFGYYAHADRVMLAKLTLIGQFHQIPEPLFFYRDHTTQSVKTISNSSSQKKKSFFGFSGPQPPIEVWDPTKKGIIDFPEWRVFVKYFDAIQAASLSQKDKLRCYGKLWHRIIVHKNWARLFRDLLMAGEKALNLSDS